MDILSYIQRINQLYGSEQQVARLPYGTQGTYDVPAQEPIPNWRDLIREEGVQVGPQVKDGGRVGFKHGGSWADWMSNHSDQMTFEEYLQIDMDKPVHPINKSAGGRVYDTRKYFKPGGLVEPGVTHYGTDAKQIEKGIYQRLNKNYRIKASRAGVMLDKTLPAGSTLEDARKVLSNWEKDNPIKVKWKPGQKIKLISKGGKGEQVVTDIVYKTPEIEKAFKKALTDYTGENKGNWSKAKLNKQFGNISQDAVEFVRTQEPALIRDTNKIFTQKYKTHLDDLGIKDWASATDQQKAVIKKRAYDILYPYERKGFSVARDQIAKNIPVLNKFEKSGQTLRYFYDIVKDRTFKKNLRAYLNGTAGEYVTEAFDQAGIKTKYKNILPKIKDHLEVWHSYENPGTAYKGQLKKAKIKKWSDLHTENMINTAKRVSLTDYKNQLDLAHRQDLIIDQNISELGIEKPEINRVLIKDAELERNKLHRKNFELVDEIKKGNNVEKNLRLINENNARITKIAELTKGRLTGITINPDTLEAVKLKPSNIMGVDAGILNKSMKDLTVADKKVLKTQILPQMIEEAKAMTPEKIASDLSGLMKDEALSKKLATRMENLKQGKQITKPVFDKSHEVYKLLQENLSDFCTQKVASGGRIGFAGCTPEQILENMNKEKQLLLEYKKGTANISEAQAARIAEKFRNASGKVLKLGARGAKFMFGPAMLWGEPLFEGAFVAHDMIGNKTPFVEALSKTYFAAPLRWTGILKEPEEYEAESLYLKKDGAGVIPGVKAYTDARNKLMKINDLRSKISNMEKEVESGVTLGAKDALSSLKKQLSKEMSGIRYDEKSLHNIMKKNEQQYNIAVELQRAERFKDVDPVKAQRKTFTEIGGGRDPRYEEMADVNLGRAQQEGVFGHYVSPEDYEQIKNLASQSGEAQGLWQKFKKQIDDMGGPGFGPYKKILAQGMEGPANRYTWGQVTTPAERYHLDRLGKLAELGGFSFEKAFGGRVPFKTGGMSRRRFLEIIGGLAGGAVAFKTGLLKIIKGSTGKTVIKAGDHIIANTKGMPDWFIPLVNRIVKEGDDVTKKLGTVEREIVHTKKIGKGEEVTVYQNLDTGNVRVEYGDKISYDNVHLEYRAPEEIVTKKGSTKTDPEFSASETEPEVVNWDGDIEWSGVNEVNKVDDLVTDTNPLKQFAKKKKPTMGDIVESSKKNKYQKKLQEDTMEQVDYIEKKRGPFPDPSDYGVSKDETVDVFEKYKGKASGGRVDYDNYLPDIEDIE